jgi:hypothetical protein
LALARSDRSTTMRASLKQKIIQVCQQKIAQKGDAVGLSFYAFFANRNDDPDLLMEAATWWIKTHKLDHFEKAKKILLLVEQE